MGVKLTNSLLGLGALLMAGQINAATILVPSDGNANFIVNQAFVETWGYSLAVFDEAAATSIAAGEITDISSIINVNLIGPFLGLNGPRYQGLLSLSNNFIVGLSADAGITWLADTGSSFGVNTTLLDFNLQADSHALVVDVNPVSVPAAVWLFGSGLIGLVGVARRKSSA